MLLGLFQFQYLSGIAYGAFIVDAVNCNLLMKVDQLLVIRETALVLINQSLFMMEMKCIQESKAKVFFGIFYYVAHKLELPKQEIESLFHILQLESMDTLQKLNHLLQKVLVQKNGIVLSQNTEIRTIIVEKLKMENAFTNTEIKSKLHVTFGI